MNLFELGFDAHFAAQLSKGRDEMSIYRVMSRRGPNFLLSNGENYFQGRPSGALSFDADTTLDIPCVGDWVEGTPPLIGGSDLGIQVLITKLFARKNLIKRRSVGTQGGEQVIAANLDTLFIVSSANDEFNLRRLERYLLMAESGGVAPKLIVSKIDLAPELENLRTALATRFSQIPIIFWSAETKAGLEQLSACLEATKSYAFVGSSGVGKSTLVNALLGTRDLATQAVREGDDRGRHTTSSSAFFRLPCGAWLLDTPGLRGLSVNSDEEKIAQQFFGDSVGACKFGNCTHTHEPGCAVLTALQRGSLEQDAYENFLKLRRENAYYERKNDKARAAAEKKNRKKLGGTLRHRITKRDY